MLVIGLTGGIASGKSAASAHFKTLGAAVISADELAREVVAAGSDGLTSLVEEFGDEILLDNGELDRKALRERIFSSDEARNLVDGLLHPRIRALSEAYISNAEEEGVDYLIYEIPLLVETGQSGRFDRIVVVDVPEQVQIDRLVERDDTSDEKANAILAAQASRKARLAIADDIVDNSGTLVELHQQIQLLHEHYVALASNRSTTG